jgi:hypothetical protein
MKLDILNKLKTGGCSSYVEHGGVFSDVLDIVRPKSILEIGFFRGGSASLWLTMSEANLLSVDPINDTATTDFLISTNQQRLIEPCDDQFVAVQSILENFPNRFSFIQKRSLQAALDGDLSNKKFDLMFCDGDHWESGVTIDLNIALSLKIPYILLDDFQTGVTEAFLKMRNKFEIIRIYNQNKIPIALVKNIVT